MRWGRLCPKYSLIPTWFKNVPPIIIVIFQEAFCRHRSSRQIRHKPTSNCEIEFIMSFCWAGCQTWVLSCLPRLPLPACMLACRALGRSESPGGSNIGGIIWPSRWNRVNWSAKSGGAIAPLTPVPTTLAWVLHEEADQKIFSQVSCHTMRLLNLV